MTYSICICLYSFNLNRQTSIISGFTLVRSWTGCRDLASSTVSSAIHVSMFNSRLLRPLRKQRETSPSHHLPSMEVYAPSLHKLKSSTAHATKKNSVKAWTGQQIQVVQHLVHVLTGIALWLAASPVHEGLYKCYSMSHTQNKILSFASSIVAKGHIPRGILSSKRWRLWPKSLAPKDRPGDGSYAAPLGSLENIGDAWNSSWSWRGRLDIVYP